VTLNDGPSRPRPGAGELRDDAKRRVYEFWNQASCGEALLLPGTDAEAYAAQRRERYRLEPFIPAFANFRHWRGARVLEIGVGLGADHESFASAKAELYGIDLTERAIEHTRARLAHAGLSSTLAVADAESLPFPAGHFDLVYSWGVLHHSPSPERAIDEVWRVLRPGGTAKLMLYHSPSVVGFMLWARYGLLRAQPWRPLRAIYAEHLESPGTRAFSVEQARALCSRFESVLVTPVLTHADLLSSEVGQRHRGALLAVARRLWPRRVIRRWFSEHGAFLLITATKAPG
jgi:SAM-dependent methyltransferase